MPLPTNMPLSPPAASHQHQTRRHIWVIIGPSGCGKTTAAKSLAEKLHLPYIEGDDFHPPQNIQKMSNGIPLTDDDRWGWLEALRDNATNMPQGCVVACSCLKKQYRDVIRLAGVRDQSVVVGFIYLSLTKGVALQRVRERRGHFFTDKMVNSQFEALEEPGADELDVVSVDAGGSKYCVGLGVAERALEYMAGGKMSAL